MTELRPPALNRRGRAIEVRVTAAPLVREGWTGGGAIIVVEQGDELSGAYVPFGGLAVADHARPLPLERAAHGQPTGMTRTGAASRSSRRSACAGA